MHKIRHETLMLLASRDSGRFRDIHPKGVAANLFSYHLTALLKQRYIRKNADQTYQLAPKGLAYVYRYNDQGDNELRPKLMVVCVMTNEKNEVLMNQIDQQPFRGTWTVPQVPVKYNDGTVWIAAQRAAYEHTGIKIDRPIRVGEAHLRIFADDELIAWIVADIFRAVLTSEQLESTEKVLGEWTSSVSRRSLKIAPGIHEIIDSALNAHTTFFEEYRLVYEG